MQFENGSSWGNTTLGAGPAKASFAGRYSRADRLGLSGGVMIHSSSVPNADFGGMNFGLIPEIGNTTSSGGVTQHIPMTQEFNASEVEVGKNALQHFQDRASGYDDYGYSNITELAAHYTKNPALFFEGIGGTILAIGEFLNESKVRDAMYAIADAGQGKIPANMTVFFQSLGNVASNPSFAESISYTSTKAIEDLGFGLNELGKSTVTSLKNANFLWQYWPYIAIAAGLIFIYSYSRSIGGVHGKLAEKVLKR